MSTEDRNGVKDQLEALTARLATLEQRLNDPANDSLHPISGSNQDILERACAHLFTQTRDYVCLLDATGRIMKANPALCAALNQEPLTLQGAQLAEFMNENDGSRLMAALSEPEPPNTLDIQAGLATASPIPHQIHWAVVRHPGGGWMLVGRDVSRVQPTQSTASADDQRWRQMSAAVSDQILLVQPDGLIVFSNHSSPLTAGLELTGRNVSDFLSGPRKDAFFRCISRVIESREPDILEIDYTAQSRIEAILEITVSPVLDHGRATLLSLCVRNVTERRQIDHRISQISKLDSLMVLAGGVAHDFNNLLTGMLGHLGLVRMQLDGQSPIQDNLDEIEMAAMAARDLAHQMLAYSGRGNFEMSAISLNDLIEAHQDSLKRILPENATLRLDLSPDVPPVQGDAKQIILLLTHLVSNAAMALGSKTGRLFVRCGYWRLPVGSYITCVSGDSIDPGPYGYIEVADEGCGMNAETLARAFDPFFSCFGGRGLGLSACLGVARAHKGAVLIESTPGIGTVVRVLLRQSRDADMQVPVQNLEAPLTAEELRPLEGAQILLVDDEPVVRSSSGTILEKAGMKLRVARDSREALEVLNWAGEELDLMLVDLTMPGMSGAALVRRIRQSYPDLPVILSSGYSRQEALRDLQDLGEVPFLSKPYGLMDLIRAVATQLNKAKQTSAKR